jgi:hypothetical protein
MTLEHGYRVPPEFLPPGEKVGRGGEDAAGEESLMGARVPSLQQQQGLAATGGGAPHRVDGEYDEGAELVLGHSTIGIPIDHPHLGTMISSLLIHTLIVYILYPSHCSRIFLHSHGLLSPHISSLSY